METPFSILSSDENQVSSLMSQIREQMDRLFEIVAQQEEDLREARIMLNRANTEVMLYGKQPPPDNRANLGSLSDSDLFIVAALELKDSAQLFGTDSSERFPARDVELMKTAVYNVFETVLGRWSIASCCESDLCFANILINLLDEEQPGDLMEQGISNALQSAIELVRQNYGIDLVAAQSAIVHGYEALPRARLAAYRILQQELPLRMQQLENVEVVPTPADVVEKAIPSANTRLEKQYFQFILGRNLEMAQLTLKELTAEDLRSTEISFAVVKLRLLNHLESLVNISGIPRSEVSFLYVRQLENESDIYTLMQDIFTAIETSRQTNTDMVQREKIEAVAAYITENYKDVNLCLAKLCGVFHMNQSYLSRTFKSVYSIGILDYIHTQRLSHVKELLKDPENNIDAIWEAVGYTNRRTFNRTFRKLEGMSASEYRRSLLSQQ